MPQRIYLAPNHGQLPATDNFSTNTKAGCTKQHRHAQVIKHTQVLSLLLEFALTLA